MKKSLGRFSWSVVGIASIALFALAPLANAQMVSNPTASLLVNGGTSVTANVNQTISYQWSSSGGTAWSSSVTANPSTCPYTGANWVADDANGTASGSILANQAGCTYTMTYVVSNGTTNGISSITVTIPGSTSTATTGTNTNTTNGELNGGKPVQSTPTTYSPNQAAAINAALAGTPSTVNPTQTLDVKDSTTGGSYGTSAVGNYGDSFNFTWSSQNGAGYYASYVDDCTPNADNADLYLPDFPITSANGTLTWTPPAPESGHTTQQCHITINYYAMALFKAPNGFVSGPVGSGGGGSSPGNVTITVNPEVNEDLCSVEGISEANCGGGSTSSAGTTASLIVRDQPVGGTYGAYTTNLSANVGDTLWYGWSSTGGTTFSSAVTAVPASCPDTGSNWIANSEGGSSSGWQVLPNQAGCTYTMTYTVSNGQGSANSSITVAVGGTNVSNSLNSTTLNNTTSATTATNTNTTGSNAAIQSQIAALLVELQQLELQASGGTATGGTTPTPINYAPSSNSSAPVTISNPTTASTATTPVTSSATSAQTATAVAPDVTFPATILVTAASLNVRSAPNTSASLAGSKTLYSGNTFTATNWVAGQSVSGIPIWWLSQAGNYVWSGGTKVEVSPVVTATGGGSGTGGSNSSHSISCPSGFVLDGSLCYFTPSESTVTTGIPISNGVSTGNAASQICTVNELGDSECTTPVTTNSVSSGPGTCTAGVSADGEKMWTCTCNPGYEADATDEGATCVLQTQSSVVVENGMCTTTLATGATSCQCNSGYVPNADNNGCVSATGNTSSCTPGETQGCKSTANSCGQVNEATQICGDNGTWSQCAATAPPDSDCSESMDNYTCDEDGQCVLTATPDGGEYVDSTCDEACVGTINLPPGGDEGGEMGGGSAGNVGPSLDCGGTSCEEYYNGD